MPQPILHSNFYEICYGYPVRFTKFNEYKDKYNWMIYEVEVCFERKPVTYTFIVPRDSQGSMVYHEWLELFQTLTGDEKYHYLASHYRLLFHQLTGTTLLPGQEDMDCDLLNEPFVVKQPATAILVLLDDLVQGVLSDTLPETSTRHIRRLKRWYRGLLDCESDSNYEDGLY